jgi:hypothetical protein
LRCQHFIACSHATVLHLFGLGHPQLTYRFQGRDFQLTDVTGEEMDKHRA